MPAPIESMLASTTPTNVSATMNIPVKTPPDVVKSFEKSYEILRDELINDLQTYNTPPEAVERMKEMLEHNVCGGKMNRGLSVIDTLSIIAQSKGHQLTKEETFKAHVLGWGVEWLQACFLVADDVMDQSHTRRGKPCWYKVEGVGFNAINDAFLLESHIYKMFKKHFRQETYYADLLDLTHEVAYQTELGQLVDMITAPENDVNLKRFSLDRHRWIVEYKTAYYSFYLSVAMAMMMSGITDPKAYGQAKSILIPLGEYFQVQDDYLDCFGDPAVIGKIGTDIEDNKCSWLINQALVLASPAQLSTLESNYGRKDAKCISEVKKIYKELKLEQVFEKYEEESHQRIMGLINSIDKSLGVPPEVYISFMKKIYKRNK